MEKIVTSNFRLGIIAGGQLGKMLIQEASKWDINTCVLDREDDCPAGKIATVFVKGDHLDFDSVYNFGKQVDLLTYEMENININALKKLKDEGLRIVPDPSILEMIQDKGLQKQLFHDNNIPTAQFKLYESKGEILESISKSEIAFPFVQKIRIGGYDGRGVAVINNNSDLDRLFDQSCLVEKKVEILKEIAVIAARNSSGEIRCYPVVEMVFDPEANLVDNLFCPANITPEQARISTEIATKLIDVFGIHGLLAIELFVDKSGDILVNEVAPRPHNSGHHTIESVVTSQFEQHLRGIFDLPLGSTKMKMPAVMVNLLGEAGFSGNVKYEGLTEAMAIDGVNIHLYGKKIAKPSRKMGHVTVVADTLSESLKKAEEVKQLIKVKSWD